MSRRDVLEVLAFLGASYPAVAVTEDMTRAWTLMLGDLDGPALKQAALRHLATSKWFPSIAELRSGVAELVCAAPAVDVALAEVVAVVGRFGERLPAGHQWSHPVIGEVVRGMTWWFITHSSAQAWREQFAADYAAARSRAVVAANVAPLLAAPAIIGHLGPGTGGDDGDDPGGEKVVVVLDPERRKRR